MASRKLSDDNVLRQAAPSNSGAISTSQDVRDSQTRSDDLCDVDSVEGESEDAKMERLGRQRPQTFKSGLAEFGFVFSVIMAQILVEYFVSGFTVIIPTLIKELHIPNESVVWPTGAYSVAVASTLLIFGRLSDMFGGRYVYIAGVTWYSAWSIITGFAQNEIMLNICRAFQGVGSAAFLPSSLMLLGSVYRPGPRKNLIFGIYAAAAPLGFYIGIFCAGLVGEFTSWGWYFWIGAVLAFLTAIASWFSLPSDYQLRRAQGVKMDYLGAVLSVVSLVIIVFVLTDSPHAANGWSTPYIYVLFIIGVLLLGALVYVEGWVATNPLLPGDVFKTKYMKPLLLALFFFYGNLGVLFLYATLYMQSVMGASPLQLVAWWSPTAVGGIMIASIGGVFLHRIPGTFLAIFAAIAWLIAPLLFALAPLGASYWAWVFPAMIATTIGIDIMFNVSNIFITNCMPARRQGLAGSMINALLQLGIAVFLGIADMVAVFGGENGQVVGNAGGGAEALGTYRRVMWFGVACAGVALLIVIGFVRIGKAKSELTADEREQVRTDEQSDG